MIDGMPFNSYREAPTALAPRTFALWFTALFALSQWPLYAVRYVDIQDFVNHAARLHLLLHLDSSPLLQRYYEWTPGIAPNLPIETIGLLLARVFGAETGLKLFASLSTLLLASGCVALSRALAREVQPIALGALLFANNLMFYYGLFNYLFGLGVALWLLAAWVTTPADWRRLPAFALGASLLYLCHLAALGVYAISVAAKLWIDWQNESTATRQDCKWKWQKQAGAAALAATQFVPAGIMHFGLFVAPVPILGSDATMSGIELVIWKLLLLVAQPSVVLSAYPLAGALVCTVLLLCVYLALRRNLITCAPFALCTAAPLLAALLVSPRSGFGSGLLDVRLGLPIALILWSGLSVVRPSRLSLNRLLPLAIAAGVAAISVEQYLEWKRREPEQAALRGALQQLPAGARVAAVTLKKADNERISEHTVTWALVDRSAFVANLYARPFQAVWIGLRADMVSDARRVSFLDPDVPPPALATIAESFDYIVAFGKAEVTATYGAAASSVYATNAVRILKP